MDDIYTLVWENVVTAAARVTYRANSFDDHPTYDTLRSIKEGGIEVQGRVSMAMQLTGYRRRPREADQALETMNQAIGALIQRRKEMRN